jgi:uncharacterized protein YndB with AHSA1/START domain
MTTPGNDEALVVRRLIAVPRVRVFAAWLDPASMAQWMCPGDVTQALVEADPRVGGEFRIVMRHAAGDEEHRGAYLVIDPPARLSFTWISSYTDHQPTVVTIELLERGQGTELILTHRRLPPAARDAHHRGWTDIVEKLAGSLQARMR